MVLLGPNTRGGFGIHLKGLLNCQKEIMQLPVICTEVENRPSEHILSSRVLKR